jgi:hypothetical protein
MVGEPEMGEPRALVVTRDDEDGNAAVGDLSQGLERLIAHGRDRSWAIEDITGVHHEVDIPSQRRIEGGEIVREEVVSSPPALDAGPNEEVVPEMGIGDEENPDFPSHEGR